AEQQEMLEHAVAAAARGIRQSLAQLFRSVGHAFEIACNRTVRRGDDDAGGMRILVERRVVAIGKSHGVGDGPRRRRRASEKMPARRGTGVMIVAKVARL